MKFTVPQKDFLGILQKLFAVVPSKTTHPILNSILFSLQGDTLSLTTTDLEISLAVSLKVTGEADGELAIPAKRLLDIVKELDEGAVMLQTSKGNQVELRSGSSNFNIPSDPAEQFPELPKINVDTELEMNGDRLKSHIDRLAFAVSSDELRPVLTGVYFEFGESCLTLVATDGHRLVRIRDEQTGGHQALGSVIVPVKALNLLAKSVSGDTIVFGMARNHIVFRMGDDVLYSRLIEGKYPAVEGVIPQDNSNILQGNRAGIQRMIKQVSHCANTITRQINLALEENKLTVSAEDSEVGSRGRSEMDVDYNGDSIEIAFNSSYLEQLMKHVGTEDVVMKFGTPDRAALILPEVNAEQEETLMLLMPVRLMR